MTLQYHYIVPGDDFVHAGEASGHLKGVLRHTGDHRADTVAAAHADNQLVQLGVINKIVLRLHIHDTLALALYYCFKFIQNRLVDRHLCVLLSH